MKSYRVNWGIDIDAKSPKDAAKQALAIQRDPASIATSFEVFNTTFTDDGIVEDHKTLVDLKPKAAPSPRVVKIRATDDEVKLTIGKEKFEFDTYLTGADLSEVLEALGIEVDYEYK